MRIERLSFSTLDQAKSLLKREFPDQFWWESSDIALPVSLYKDAADRTARRVLSRVILRLAGVTDVSYWVAVEGDAVVGISGYYSLRRDPSGTGWGGWSCVAPEYRGGLPRVGGALIRTVAREAARNGKRVVRLYTVSTDPSMMNFLSRRGFKTAARVGHFPSLEKVRYVEGDVDALLGGPRIIPGDRTSSARARVQPCESSSTSLSRPTRPERPAFSPGSGPRGST
jgi:ribosomal protein S18 acetylase RimI-like enzyme